MSADDHRFDPRFDPAFQRGYSGAAPSAPPAVSPAPAKRMIDSPPRTPPAPHRMVDAEPAPRGVLGHDEAEDFDEAPARRINPFLIALGAIAALLVGGGAYLASRVSDLFASTQGQSGFDFVTVQVFIVAAPILVGLGLATGVGVLFVYAVRWGRPAASSHR